MKDHEPKEQSLESVNHQKAKSAPGTIKILDVKTGKISLQPITPELSEQFIKSMKAQPGEWD